MTQPNQDPNASSSSSGGSGDGKGKSGKPATVNPLDVVTYTHHDPVFGTEHRAVGVVVAVDTGAVTIRPLAHHHVQVDASAVTATLTADQADDV